jgi:hypothetical protein
MSWEHTNTPSSSNSTGVDWYVSTTGANYNAGGNGVAASGLLVYLFGNTKTTYNPLNVDAAKKTTPSC